MPFVDVSAVALCAWNFIERPKDYGGVHLGVWRRSVPVLHQVIDELTAAEAGFSRRLPLLAVPRQLPGELYTRGGYIELARLRLGRAADSHSAIETAGTSATVVLAGAKLAVLRGLITGVESGRGDACVCGDSDAWHDRLWIWPAE